MKNQVSFLIGTDLLSMLESKQAPPKLELWVQHNEADIFLSVVSFADSPQSRLRVWIL